MGCSESGFLAVQPVQGGRAGPSVVPLYVWRDGMRVKLFIGMWRVAQLGWRTVVRKNRGRRKIVCSGISRTASEFVQDTRCMNESGRLLYESSVSIEYVRSRSSFRLMGQWDHKKGRVISYIRAQAVAPKTGYPLLDAPLNLRHHIIFVTVPFV
jgi:hypothetical protein